MNDLRYITSDELATFLVENGEKKFRLGQIEDWLWKKGAQNLDEMRNISTDLKNLNSATL